MPKLTVVERDGELVIVSQVEAKGGPPDTFIGLRPDKTYIAKATKQAAEDFIRETGGKLYMVTHWLHNGEWLPKSYKIKEVPNG